jgi:hypothetical protein
MRTRAPSPAMLVALLALFVALGGSSYAAVKLGKNSVGTRQLKKNSVTSPKVKPRSLLVSDFKKSQRSRLRGPQGPQGPAGANGQPGSSAASMLTGRVPAAILNTSGGSTTAFDPAGDAQGAARGLSPAAPVVVRDLSVLVTVAPGAGSTRTFRLGISQFGGGADPAIFCSIAGTETSCNTGGQTVTIPASSEINLSSVVTGAAATASQVQFGYRAVTP